MRPLTLMLYGLLGAAIIGVVIGSLLVLEGVL